MAQGRNRFDVEGKGGAFAPLVFAAQSNVGHFKLISHPFQVYGSDVDRFAGFFKHSQVLPTVISTYGGILSDAQGHMKIKVRQRFGNAGQILYVLVGSAATFAGIGVNGEGGIGTGAEVHLVLVEFHLVLAISSVDHHFAGNRSQGFIHNPGGNFDQAAVFDGVFYNGSA